GRLPFVGKSEAEIVSALLKERHTPATKINKQTPGRLSAVIDRALEKEPERRYRSMEEMISALRQAIVEAHGGNRLGVAMFGRLYKGAAATILVIASAGVLYHFWPRQAQSHAIRSIAVLPFKPLTVDSRDEALEMGMADTLITRLSGLKQLVVRPISAVRRYAVPEQDASAASREQRVDAELDGSMQKSGERIRETVRLMNVADGRQLWADEFEEKFTDIFAVQDSIAQRVAAELAGTFTGQEKEQLAKR